MTEPNKLLLADPRVPSIEFAGQKWPIPRLAVDQLAEVWSLVSGSLAKVIAGGIEKINLSTISAPLIKDMATAVYWGLRGGHPDLTREQFDAMASDVGELCAAMVVVAAQTGGFKVRKPGEAPPTPGEAKRAPRLNGTPSPLRSVRAPAGRGATSARR
jgi:hypothetical protein